MNPEFSPRYLALLHNQVDQETQFLIKNGHETTKIVVPCIFCIPDHMGSYRCKRLEELKKFKLTLLTHRRRIGFEIEPVEESSIQPEPIAQLSEEPQLFTLKFKK